MFAINWWLVRDGEFVFLLLHQSLGTFTVEAAEEKYF
jgi:hypothetical protein